MMEKGIEAEGVELAKKRCKAVIERIERLSITDSCKRTLLRLAHSELNFLSSIPLALSLNIGHLEALVHILQQPFITGVSRVCNPIPLSPSKSKLDIVCTLNRNPVWIIVSDRNPTYISWDTSPKTKGFKLRIQQLLTLAHSTLTLKPSSIILFFSNGLHNSLTDKLKQEFGASEIELQFSVFDFDFTQDGEWINVVGRSYREACVLEIKVDVKASSVAAFVPKLLERPIQRIAAVGDAFGSLLSRLNICPWDVQNLGDKGDVINFDTTALIALVSGISNGCTDKLLSTPETELRHRFKGNYAFVIGQVMSEIQNPIHVELGSLITGKRGIICESVHSEFKELVLMCGGPNEKFRADQLLNYLTLGSLRFLRDEVAQSFHTRSWVVSDSPSERVMGLPTTRKLALKNKVVFGTGDYWHAPTVTANMAFARAISQTGMSLFTIEHRPRALTGD